MLKQCPECFCWWEDGANFCSIDGASLPESTDPLAKLQYMTIKQIVGCMKRLAMQEFGDQAAIKPAIENLGKKIEVTIRGEKLSTVGVVALGMLTNVMGRFDLREVNSTPSAPKPSTRIQ